ncbi:phosphatidylethanolamine N-methyltransferase isoform X3 [Camelus dromedarius]|uniref:phosphatidylethanolamine N-methyltransferase isoform X3 n=1 Tax=Camelus dromedarius TaxID=9838 RepID=UPI0031198F3D
MGPVLGAEGCRKAPARRPAPRGLGRAGPMHSLAAGPDCCGGLGNLDFRQADLCVMTWLLGYVDPSDPRFVAAVLAIAFNPLFWNVEARDWGPEEPGQRPPPDPGGRLKQGSLPRFCGRTWTSPRPAFSCYTLYPSLPGAAGGKGRQMGAQDPQAEQGLPVTPPGLLHPGRRHPAPERAAFPLARQPHRPVADRGGGPHLRCRHPVRGALHC